MTNFREELVTAVQLLTSGQSQKYNSGEIQASYHDYPIKLDRFHKVKKKLSPRHLILHDAFEDDHRGKRAVPYDSDKKRNDTGVTYAAFRAMRIFPRNWYYRQLHLSPGC